MLDCGHQRDSKKVFVERCALQHVCPTLAKLVICRIGRSAQSFFASEGGTRFVLIIQPLILCTDFATIQS